MSGKPTLEEQLRRAREQLGAWRESRDRALTQLNSIHNLVSQLETLQQCSGATGQSHLLGVVGEHPFCVQLLQAKLVQVMERAYMCAMKEK